jgi:hypothetical protein
MTPITIVAHSQRAQQAENLAKQVGATITWDAREHLKLGTNLGCALTHLDALKNFSVNETSSEWVTVLEDDAQPVTHFNDYLAGCLEYAPAPIVGLYLGTGNPSGESQRQIRQAVVTAQQRNLAWITADCLIGSVGYAIETHLLPDLIDFIDGRDEELPLRITRWAQDRNINICYTQPSLVNHDDTDSIGNPWRGPKRLQRRAWSFGGRNCWCTGSTKLGYCPIWSKEKT